ncbi:MAG: 16S rRNA (guanine(527)-N(7))-methyltransferase RsmG [Ardenticatenaceae bacterium]
MSLAQLEQFRQYCHELVDWNRGVNLTTITDWDEVQTRHFADSLSVALAIPPEKLAECRLADIGSGAGFPGLPLKIALPGLQVTLVESTAKKTAFLRHVVDVLELTGVDIRAGRAETLSHEPEMREAFDVVTARAVAAMNTLAELMLPFCRIGGVAIAQKGHDLDEELRQAERAISILGGIIKEVKQISIEGQRGPRALVIVEKIRATPDQYPRRPGMPAKRPL